MHIPSPDEIIERMMKKEMDKIDKDGLYPCCDCGVRGDPGDMLPVGSEPFSPMICDKCADKNRKINDRRKVKEDR